jgi:hypothetical protein
MSLSLQQLSGSVQLALPLTTNQLILRPAQLLSFSRSALWGLALSCLLPSPNTPAGTPVHHHHHDPLLQLDSWSRGAHDNSRAFARIAHNSGYPISSSACYFNYNRRTCSNVEIRTPQLHSARRVGIVFRSAVRAVRQL